MTGLQTLDEVCRRIDSLWGTDVKWMKSYELAALIASGNTRYA